MTQKELNEIKPIICEISDLKKRILNERIISADGRIAYTSDGWEMFSKLYELENRVSEAKEWIDNLDDSKISQVFKYRYLDGLTWQSIAFKVGEFDESYVRRKHKRYLS